MKTYGLKQKSKGLELVSVTTQTLYEYAKWKLMKISSEITINDLEAVS